MKGLQGKLQLCKLVSAWLKTWRCHLQLSLSSRQRPVLEDKAHHLLQQPISSQLCHLSLKHNIEKMACDWPKNPVTVLIQSHGEVQKSSVLSDHLNYNLLRGYFGILLSNTKYKLPTPALKSICTMKNKNLWMFKFVLLSISTLFHLSLPA